MDRVLTDEQIEKAFQVWLFTHYEFRSLDDKVAPFLSSIIQRQSGWLKCVREALFLSMENVAGRLGVSRASYDVLEKNEASGRITMNSLHRVAEAMGCEVVYAVRPKNKTTFSRVIWRQLLEESRKHPWIKNRSQGQMVRTLVGLAGTRMRDAQVRRKLGWTMW